MSTKERPSIQEIRRNPKLWIRTFLKIPNRRGQLVPFIFNDWQSRYYDYLIEKYWKPYELPNGRVGMRFQGMREVNVKCRDIGSTSLILAIFLHDSCHWTGTHTKLYAQDEIYSKGLLKKAKDMFLTIPNSTQSRPETGHDNPFELELKAMRSFIKCSTPGSSDDVAEKQGRGPDNHNLLLTELPFYPKPETTMGALLGRTHEDGNVVVESTGKHINDALHSLYDDGQNPDDIWNSHFWLWVDFRGFSDKVTTKQEEKKILAKLNVEERRLVKNHDATAGQIKFRRRKISELRSEMKFRREYPETLLDAFQSQGELYFIDDNIDFKALLTKERDPIPGHIHMITVDTASGIRKDYSTIVVTDFVTREQIYLWRSNTIRPELLHIEIYKIWRKYRGVVGIESNSIGRAVIVQARNDQTPVTDERGQRTTLSRDWDYFVHCGNRNHDGIYTSHASKPMMLSSMRASLRDAIEHHEGGGDWNGLPAGLRLSSRFITDEMNYFVDMGNGKMEAPGGGKLHDDAIMACALQFSLVHYMEGYMKKFKKRFGAIKDVRRIA